MGSIDPVHRSILAVDIERSTVDVRTNPIKLELRAQVYRMLLGAMAHAGVDACWCEPFEDRGDGVLVLIRPVDELPKPRLLSQLIPELARALTDYNRALPPSELARRELRLRAVLHAGEVHLDENGYCGEEVDVACRLLDAPSVKRCLRAAPGPLVLVVSQEIYWGIVRHEYDGIGPDTYRPHVWVNVGGRRRRGFVHVPPAPRDEAVPA
ncbi:hypothetical protein [Actinomadura rupiterrae]|uniref:hypothetical protein n=1 Tax=Actinomadura rupiterrae TaxID=559627 RepID=UPI0020A340F5|nr:hypothetical protein [Actinomadura rupiterrae]MCP2343423.1 class 3 adenylate cyclase [Actinomadura rupiterrae]